MARSSSWKGYLKLSLVTCAVAMAPAQSDRENVASIISRLTMNNRERWIAVQPRGKGILLTTMRYPYEVR